MAKKYNILLVDDDRLLRQMTRVYMQRKGYNLDLAENGKDALDKCREKEYDLIMMDVRMPVMDGLEATRRIRRIEKRSGKKQAPIVAVTSSANEDVCIRSGMNHYFQKPILMDQIQEILTFVEKK